MTGVKSCSLTSCIFFLFLFFKKGKKSNALFCYRCVYRAGMKCAPRSSHHSNRRCGSFLALEATRLQRCCTSLFFKKDIKSAANSPSPALFQGFFGKRKNCFSIAVRAAERSMTNAYIGRKQKKRNMRQVGYCGFGFYTFLSPFLFHRAHFISFLSHFFFSTCTAHVQRAMKALQPIFDECTSCVGVGDIFTCDTA